MKQSAPDGRILGFRFLIRHRDAKSTDVFGATGITVRLTPLQTPKAIVGLAVLDASAPGVNQPNNRTISDTEGAGTGARSVEARSDAVDDLWHHRTHAASSRDRCAAVMFVFGRHYHGLT
jgi:hypothetical protein